MAVLTKAGSFQVQIDQAPRLEALAEQVQGDDEVADQAAATALAPLYRKWYCTCIEILPDDLRDRFRREHDGGFPNYKIKHFLQDGRKLNSFYRADLAEAGQVQLLGPWQYSYKDSFYGPLQQQLQCLEQALARLGSSSATLDALDLLEQIGRRLPVTFAILAETHRDQPGIAVRNEYDMQHILHSVTVLHFEEVESEEPTPKMAGGASRLDFLLKREQVAIETKMTRDGLGPKQLRDELAKDIVFFKAHQDVKALFILVYDPSRKILNTAGFEGDLTSTSDNFPIRVVVAR